MLTPRHSFGSISQRIDAFCPEMRAAQTTICADAALTQSARRRVALAHLDRGADPALRAFKNGSRHDIADRIFAPSKPQLFALRLEAEQQCAARCMLAAVPVFLFGVWGSSKPPSRSPAAVRNALFEAPTVRSG
jgi:hypothetical protein